MIYVTGPGHGGPGLVANAYLEGTYSEVYPDIGQDEDGLKRLFTQFSFPGGIPSHVAPETPGSIHEGGELGYALSHAYGAAFDNPDLIVACVVGDGEAETGPLATSWHSNKFLNPVTDGVVLPILHLNGYKIANPTVLARIPPEELDALFRGYGYVPHVVEGSRARRDAPADGEHPRRRHRRDPEDQGRRPAERLHGASPLAHDRAPHAEGLDRPQGGRRQADRGLLAVPPGPDGRDEGRTRPTCAFSRTGCGATGPRSCSPRTAGSTPELAALAPRGLRRMSANPHTNGGVLLRELRLPDFRDYAVEVKAPGAVSAESTRIMGRFLRDVMALNREARNFRLFSPDENNSNRWQDVLEVTNRAWVAETVPGDDHLAPDGRVMEMLSEHQCQGWLEGYLLTGRHGFFSCYEAFIHIVDSMLNQHAKWLKVCNRIPWRRPIASLNYLLSSHVWRQDHNGFSHQDPGFIDHVVNKKAEVVRVYLPPDANCLLSVTDHCLRSRNYVNVVVAGKQPAPQWLTMDQAIAHCTAGLGIWEWASSDGEAEPDVVMACCGDVPTLETLAAVDLLRQHVPDLRVRVINVVDLMKLQPASEHPHGLSDRDFDVLFTTDKPIIFAFHGYPWLIHRLTYRRTEPPEPPRPRVQGRRDHHHPVRHVRAERPRPLSPGERRDRPRAEARRPCRLCQAGDPREAHRAQAVHRAIRRRHARDHRLALAAGGHGHRRSFDGGRQCLRLRNGSGSCSSTGAGPSSSPAPATRSTSGTCSSTTCAIRRRSRRATATRRWRAPCATSSPSGGSGRSRRTTR